MAKSARTTFGDRLASLRNEKDIKQAVAAEAVGISRSTLAGLEAGHDLPGRDTLRALADYYRVSMDWLATGHGDRTPVALESRTARIAELFERLDDGGKDALEIMAETLARRPT